MQLTPHITIRDFPQSEALEHNIKEHINKLNQFYNRIMHCDVVVEQAQKQKHQGKLYRTRITMTVPSGEIVINKQVHEDVYVSVRDAFNAARRKITNFSKVQRGVVKTHDLTYRGTVVRIFEKEGYGFIESNGSEYYFSSTNVVHPDFDRLEIGTNVNFIESYGNEGLQANRVSAREQ